MPAIGAAHGESQRCGRHGQVHRHLSCVFERSCGRTGEEWVCLSTCASFSFCRAQPAPASTRETDVGFQIFCGFRNRGEGAALRTQIEATARDRHPS